MHGMTSREMFCNCSRYTVLAVMPIRSAARTMDAAVMTPSCWGMPALSVAEETGLPMSRLMMDRQMTRGGW